MVMPCHWHMHAINRARLTDPSTPAGQDAVEYFHDFRKNRGRPGLFVFCNLANESRWDYLPYDLCVVSREAAHEEHYIISSTGVCHVTAHGAVVTPLHVWLTEAHYFHLLRNLTFFRKHAMVKAWFSWRTKHQRGKFARRAAALEANHPMLNSVFGPAMCAVHADVSALTAGTTGLWEQVGFGWQPTSHAYMLKWISRSSSEVTEAALLSGHLCVPLRLAFIGHENTLHQLKGFQAMRSEAREFVAQVRPLDPSYGAEHAATRKPAVADLCFWSRSALGGSVTDSVRHSRDCKRSGARALGGKPS